MVGNIYYAGLGGLNEKRVVFRIMEDCKLEKKSGAF